MSTLLIEFLSFYPGTKPTPVFISLVFHFIGRHPFSEGNILGNKMLWLESIFDVFGSHFWFKGRLGLA